MDKKSSQFVLRITEPLWGRVDVIAGRLGVSRSTVIRYALDRMLPEIERDGLVFKPEGQSLAGRLQAPQTRARRVMGAA